jgi:hypothetical protein
VSEEEYRDFYKTLKLSETAETLGWAHWKVGALALFSERYELIPFDGDHSSDREIPVVACLSGRCCTSRAPFQRTFGKKWRL